MYVEYSRTFSLPSPQINFYQKLININFFALTSISSYISRLLLRRAETIASKYFKLIYNYFELFRECLAHSRFYNRVMINAYSNF